MRQKIKSKSEFLFFSVWCHHDEEQDTCSYFMLIASLLLHRISFKHYFTRISVYRETNCVVGININAFKYLKLIITSVYCFILVSTAVQILHQKWMNEWQHLFFCNTLSTNKPLHDMTSESLIQWLIIESYNAVLVYRFKICHTYERITTTHARTHTFYGCDWINHLKRQFTQK